MIVKNLFYTFYDQNFKDLEHQAAWCYQLIGRLTLQDFKLNQRNDLIDGTFAETQERIINELIEPIVNCLIDKLEKKVTPFFTY